MKLFKIIEIAKSKGIMPILKDGVWLEINKDKVLMVKEIFTRNGIRKITRRTLFVIEKGDIKFSPAPESMLENYGYVGFNGKYSFDWRDVAVHIEEIETFYKKKQLGQHPVKKEKTIYYEDENGKEIEIKEMRTVIEPLYKNIPYTKTIYKTKFYKGDK